jgi:hypothetical protein
MGANITVVVVPALYEFMEVIVVLGLGSANSRWVTEFVLKSAGG